MTNLKDFENRKMPTSKTFGLEAALGKAESPRAKHVLLGEQTPGQLGSGEAEVPHAEGNPYVHHSAKTFEEYFKKCLGDSGDMEAERNKAHVVKRAL